MEWSAETFFDLSEFEHAALFRSVERVWDLLAKLSAYLRAHIRGGVHPGAEIMPGATLIGEDIQIGDGSVVEAGAFLRGPILLGRNCQVRHGAYLRGDVLAGDGCLFGHASEFKTAVLLNGAKAPHFNYVGDSILGANGNMGAGSKLSNVRMIHGNVFVTAGSQRIDSGLRKFGAVVGDGGEIGCNAVLNPGTVLGRNCMVYPNATVGGHYPSGSIIKLRQQLEIVQRR